MNAMQMLARSPEADRIYCEARRCVDELEHRRSYLGHEEAQRAYQMHVAALAHRSMRDEMQPWLDASMKFMAVMLPSTPRPPALDEIQKHLDAIVAKWNGVVNELIGPA